MMQTLLYFNGVVGVRSERTFKILLKMQRLAASFVPFKVTAEPGLTKSIASRILTYVKYCPDF